MILNLTDLSDEPLQAQISRQIRAQILSGDLVANENLPSIRALARDHKVSVITVQRAYELLIKEGVIHARRGKGYFVSPLQAEEKQALAEQRLATQLERPVQAALDGGLSAVSIHKVVTFLIEKKNNDIV